MRDRLLLCGAALAAFGASLGSGFHFDDYGIFSDPLLASADGWKTLGNLARARPLTDLTYWLNSIAGGPVAYHALNLALHLAAVWLAFECLRRVLPERAALVAAAIFAVHPLQAEAVNYVSARGMVLATVLCLAAWLAWLRGQRWTTVACFAAALLAQPECAAFPAILALTNRKPRAPLAAMLSLSAAALARALLVRPQAALSPWRYFLAEGVAIWRYLRLLIVPYGFTIDPDVPSPAPWIGLLAWAALVGLAYLAWRRRWRWLLLGLVLLLPSSSVFPAPDLAADSRMYLPLLALSVAAALALERAPTSVVLPAAASVVVLLVALSIARCVVWNSDQALWREAVARAPHKIRAKIQLARALPAGQALELLAAARRDEPQNPQIAAEIGRVLLSQGQTDAALDELSRSLAVNPRDALTLNNRGVALEQLGQTVAARADFERALRIDPALTAARENLARLNGER